MNTPAITLHHVRNVLSCLITTGCLLGAQSHAAVTDISDAPMVTKNTANSAKPNILFILDDSGSMDRHYVPDGLSSSDAGYRNSTCNPIYYNPSTTYAIPIDAAGTKLNNSDQTSFTAAYRNGFHAYNNTFSTGKVDLSSSFQADGSAGDAGSHTAQAGYYWSLASGVAATTPLVPGNAACAINASSGATTVAVCCDTRGDGNYNESCGNREDRTVASCSGAGKTLVWEKHSLAGATAAEKQNFANWYSYYRTRMYMMKSASALAFQPLGDKHRLGFMTIHPGTFDEGTGAASGSDVSSSRFLKIKDNDTTQKTDWYNKLFSQTADNSTPLRTALSVAGRYYAGYNNGINKGMIPAKADDPVQYACQANFTILTTDGYWNGGGTRDLGGTNTLANQDGNIAELDAYRAASEKYTMSPRPIYDGGLTSYEWKSATNIYQYANCSLTRLQEKVTQIQYQDLQRQQRTQQIQSNTGTLQYQDNQLQRQTANLQRRTSSNSGGTWSAWANVGSCNPDNVNPNLTQCRYSATTGAAATWSNWTGDNSCTATTPTQESNFWVSTAVRCQTVNGAWTNTSSCTVDNSPNSSGWTRACRVDWQGWVDASSCSAINSGMTRRQCQTLDSGWGNVASCNPSVSGGQTITCQWIQTGTWVDAASCTATASRICQQNTVSNWAFNDACVASGPDGAGVQVFCQSATDTNGKKIQYKNKTTTTVYDGPNQSGQILTPASSVYGSWTDLTPVTCYADASKPALPADNTVAAGSSLPSTPGGCGAWPCETVSTTGGTSDTLADAAQYYYKTDLRYCSWDAMTSTQRTATGQTRDAFCISENARCMSPLNNALSICHNAVVARGTGTEDDRANWQHMTTFTMGLGISGSLTYDKNYKTANTGAFHHLRGNPVVIDWPSPHASDAAKVDDLWHAAVNGRGLYFSAEKPDDVISGLKSALQAIEKTTGSAAASSTSNQQPIEGDNFVYSASFTTRDWVGDLAAYEIDPDTGVIKSPANWSGQAKLDGQRGQACDNRTIKVFNSSGTDNLVDFTWDTKSCDAAFQPTGTATTGLSTEKTHFGATNVAQFSHYPSMSDSSGTVDQRTLAADQLLVNYLRGQNGREGFLSGPPATSNDANKLYRKREHVLGDIVTSQPLFIKGPVNNFTDPGYVTFKNNKKNREPIVYVGANDGMLHAFYAGTPILADGTEDAYDESGLPLLNADNSPQKYAVGSVMRASGTGQIKMSANAGKEAWGFIPTMVLPNMWALASEEYSLEANHRYMVDGSPTGADVYDKYVGSCGSVTPPTPENCWKTIVVGGLNKGGKGYYALDVTNPTSPKGLWEFKQGTCYDDTDASTHAATNGADCNLGYSYGKPVIGKLANGTWVVLVTSGLNNTTGDGKGYLYVLDAITGKIIRRIGTEEGSVTSPSGLSHITAWADDADKDNTLKFAYSVDLFGNVWRFDINNTLEPGDNVWVTKLAQLKDPSGNPQPITTRPRLGLVNADPFVYVGTGKFLGDSDKTDTQKQTIWALKDPLTEATLTNLRTTLGKRVFKKEGEDPNFYRVIDTALSGACVPGNGWYADLPDTGERINIDMVLARGTLIFGSNVPTTDACDKGGYAWIHYLDAVSGCAVPVDITLKAGTRFFSSSGESSMLSGIYAISTTGGKTVGGATMTTGGPPQSFEIPTAGGLPGGKRVSWREIVQ